MRRSAAPLRPHAQRGMAMVVAIWAILMVTVVIWLMQLRGSMATAQAKQGVSAQAEVDAAVQAMSSWYAAGAGDGLARTGATPDEASLRAQVPGLPPAVRVAMSTPLGPAPCALDPMSCRPGRWLVAWRPMGDPAADSDVRDGIDWAALRAGAAWSAVDTRRQYAERMKRAEGVLDTIGSALAAFYAAQRGADRLDYVTRDYWSYFDCDALGIAEDDWFCSDGQIPRAEQAAARLGLAVGDMLFEAQSVSLVLNAGVRPRSVTMTLETPWGFEFVKKVTEP